MIEEEVALPEEEFENFDHVPESEDHPPVTGPGPLLEQEVHTPPSPTEAESPIIHTAPADDEATDRGDESPQIDQTEQGIEYIR